MSLSLMKSIATCRVDTANSSRVQSDRFLNPNNLMCPNWNGTDSVGRNVCKDSWNTKSPGCNLSSERIDVENNLRPQYFEYINLNASGVNADFYGPNPPSAVSATANSQRFQNNIYKSVGSWGADMRANVRGGCAYQSPN
jgi:hypothetical protein